MVKRLLWPNLSSEITFLNCYWEQPFESVAVATVVNQFCQFCNTCKLLQMIAKLQPLLMAPPSVVARFLTTGGQTYISGWINEIRQVIDPIPPPHFDQKSQGQMSPGSLFEGVFKMALSCSMEVFVEMLLRRSGKSQKRKETDTFSIQETNP